MGWGDVRYCFAMAILVIIILLSFFCQKCVRHITRRLLNDMVVIHLCVKLSVFAVSMAMAGILKFPSLKAIYTHAIQHFY
jgi:hypothetical protein